ncbi:MAG: SPFH domain-containing protein, partial [Opitutaceae bacterium]
MKTESIPATTNREQAVTAASGWLMLFVTILCFATFIAVLIASTNGAIDRNPAVIVPTMLGSLFGGIFLCCGFFTLQPNEAAVLILFGQYKGTVRSSGFRWTNPFVRRGKISLRARNFNSDKIKVNDKRGNPIEIGAVVVWRVSDTAQAAFDVDHYESYVSIQSEAALRHVAGNYAYDDAEHNEITLRGGGDVVA